MNRRMMMAAAKGAEPLLPSAYQQVEWIGKTAQSSNACLWINTFTFLPNDTLRIRVNVEGAIDNSSEQAIAGCPTQYSAIDGFPTRAEISPDGAAWEIYRTTSNRNFSVWNIGRKNWMQLKKSEYTDDIATVTVAALIQFRYMLLFIYRPDKYLWYGKIYETSVTRNGEIVLNLIPCYKKADGEIGMFDTVSKTFFSNVGSGEFTKGANV